MQERHDAEHSGWSSSWDVLRDWSFTPPKMIFDWSEWGQFSSSWSSSPYFTTKLHCYSFFHRWMIELLCDANIGVVEGRLMDEEGWVFGSFNKCRPRSRISWVAYLDPWLMTHADCEGLRAVVYGDRSKFSYWMPMKKINEKLLCFCLFFLFSWYDLAPLFFLHITIYTLNSRSISRSKPTLSSLMIVRSFFLQVEFIFLFPPFFKS